MPGTTPEIRSIHRRLPDGDARLTDSAMKLMLLCYRWQQFPSLFQPWDAGSLVFTVGAMSRKLHIPTTRVRDNIARLEALGLLRLVEAGHHRICVLPDWPIPPAQEMPK
jgi:hypothetical protein